MESELKQAAKNAGFIDPVYSSDEPNDDDWHQVITRKRGKYKVETAFFDKDAGMWTLGDECKRPLEILGYDRTVRIKRHKEIHVEYDAAMRLAEAIVKDAARRYKHVYKAYLNGEKQYQDVVSASHAFPTWMFDDDDVSMICKTLQRQVELEREEKT